MTPEQIIKTYKLDKERWTRKAFHGRLCYYAFIRRLAFEPMQAYFGIQNHITAFAIHGESAEWWWNHADMERIGAWFIRRVEKNPRILQQLVRDWKKRVRALERMMAIVDHEAQKDTSVATLEKLYQRWLRASVDAFAVALDVQDPVSMHADTLLFPRFIKIFEKKGLSFTEDFPKVIAPDVPSFLSQEYHGRLELLAMTQRGVSEQSPAYKKALAAHAKKWHWIKNNYAVDICLGPDDMAKSVRALHRLNAQKELDRLRAEAKEAKRHKTKILQQLNLSARDRAMVDMLSLFAWMQDIRKTYTMLGAHYYEKFFSLLRQRVHFTKREQSFLTLEEVFAAAHLGRQIDREEIRHRSLATLCVNTPKGSFMYSGALAEGVYQKIFASKTDGVTELKGVVASVGTVRGRVRVILQLGEMSSMQKGEILVAAMTRPDYMVAIRKAKAIVTDEGGVTSHAAVVSRELGIPCVIGTKIATRVLKTGDMIDVDARKGIVRKITK